MKRVTVIGLLLATAFISSCATGKGDSDEDFREFLTQGRLRLFITVTWAPTEPLPPGSTVRATLYDETEELRPAISSHSHTTRGERILEVRLEVTYPLEELEDDHEHILRGTIKDSEGKLLYHSASPIVVDVEVDENMDWDGNPIETHNIDDDDEKEEDREQRIHLPMVPPVPRCIEAPWRIGALSSGSLAPFASCEQYMDGALDTQHRGARR